MHCWEVEAENLILLHKECHNRNLLVQLKHGAIIQLYYVVKLQICYTFLQMSVEKEWKSWLYWSQQEYFHQPILLREFMEVTGTESLCWRQNNSKSVLNDLEKQRLKKNFQLPKAMYWLIPNVQWRKLKNPNSSKIYMIILSGLKNPVFQGWISFYYSLLLSGSTYILL